MDEPTGTKWSEKLLLLLLGGLICPLIVAITLSSCEGKKSEERAKQQPFEGKKSEERAKQEPLGEEKRDPTLPPPGVKVIAPEDAKRFVGEYCAIEIRVRAAKPSKKGTVWFLNSASNYRNPDNITVMIGEAATKELAKTITPSATYFLGKRVRVVGTIRLYQDRPEVVVNELGQLTILPQ